MTSNAGWKTSVKKHFVRGINSQQWGIV